MACQSSLAQDPHSWLQDKFNDWSDLWQVATSTALKEAVKYDKRTEQGKFKMIDFLLKHNLEIGKTKSKCGKTALHAACKRGDRQLLKQLLEHLRKNSSLADQVCSITVPVLFTTT